MSLLSFLGGVAEGMSEDIDRKRALADKEKLMESEAEKQIKLMKERSAEEERVYQARRKTEKAEREADALQTFISLGMDSNQAKTMTTLSSGVQNLAIEKFATNPDIEWNDYFTVAEATGESVGNLIGGKRYSFSFAKPKKTFKTPEEMNDDNQVSLILAMQNNDEALIEDLRKKQEAIDKILLKGVDEKSPFAKRNIDTIANSTKAFSKLGKYGEYNSQNGTFYVDIEAKVKGSAFQFAEAYSSFQNSFDTKMQPYSSLEEVVAMKNAHKVELQEHVNTTIENAVMNRGQPRQTGKPFVFDVVQDVGVDLTSSMFEGAQLNDIIYVTKKLEDGSEQRYQFIYGGSLRQSFNDQGRPKYLYR